MTANLLDFDLEGLAAFCEQLGEKRFRATQLFRWIHQRGASDFGADDRSREVAARKLAGHAPASRRCRVITQQESADGTDQVAVRRRRRQRRRGRVHPRGRPRHAVRVVAGRLRRRLPLLLHGHQGFSRNLTTGEIVAQLWFAEHFLRKHLEDRRRARHLQRGDDGHGRAAAELRGAGAGAAHDAGRPRLRPVAPPRDGVHLRRGADDRPPRATTARWRWRCRCTRPTTRCATTSCRSIASTRSPSCWMPATATSSTRRATSSPSSTACSMA